MTAKQFYDWQTHGGTDDVIRVINVLERIDAKWCAIGGIAVNHWAENPMVTQDFDLVIAATDSERAISALEEAGFKSERFQWSVNFSGNSAVSIQVSLEKFYHSYPERAVPADVHGILMRVASLEDTMQGKIKAWSEPTRRQSKRIKDLADIARLVESFPDLWLKLDDKLQTLINQPI